MLSTKLKEAAGNGADATLYVDDVFSTYLYTGNGSTQTITNGIDLAGKGGLVWVKRRNGSSNQVLVDSSNSLSSYLASNLTNGSISPGWPAFVFNSDGFNPPAASNGEVNGTSGTYASWTFRKAAKFFDVVTYTGTGSARTIAHSLGVAPGMVIVKRTDTSSDWQVYHRSLTSAAYSIQLNLTNAQASASTVWNSTAPTSSVFSVGTDASVNASGGTYVAYLYAHDTSSTGIIQCGSFTTDGSNAATVNLGWEPQYCLMKAANISQSWRLLDTMRGWSLAGGDLPLFPDLSDAEGNFGSVGSPTATGFTINSFNASQTYIYMAIRMPNKPPTSGTQVYNAIARTGNATTTSLSTGFAPDLVIDKGRDGRSGWFWDKLRGVSKYLGADLTNSDMTLTDSILSFDNLGITVGSDTTGSRINGPYPYANWFFKRAPGFFDEVCYTGDGSNPQYLNHNLGVEPNLIIFKNRSASQDWFVSYTQTGIGIKLNSSASQLFAGTPMTVGSTLIAAYANIYSGAWTTNTTSNNYVAYLFATLAGISKVGSYTGNGTGQAIACGFSAGARFVLIKRTDSTGDWYTFDSARGLTSGSSPYLLLNSTAAEVTGNNGVYASTGGFTLGATASTTTNINGASYIYLSVA